MLTRMINRMQLIPRIFIRWDTLLKVKLSHYMIRVMQLNKLKKYKGTTDVYKFMADVHITRVVAKSFAE